MKDVLHMSITPFQVGLVVKKCKGKLDCLIYEMLFIKNKRPCLKIQSDSTRAKLSSFSCTLFIASHGIHRGYYTVVRRLFSNGKNNVSPVRFVHSSDIVLATTT